MAELANSSEKKEGSIVKAAVFRGKGVLSVEDVPTPAIGAEEVLMRVTHCAICGSDLHRWLFGMLAPGTIMGHEYSGTVVDTGSDVHDLQIGDRVTRSGGKIVPGKDVAPMPARYTAKKLGFSPRLRPGAYAEYMAVGADRVMRVPDSLTNLEACLTEPLTIALHAVRVSKIRLGDQALVIGAGPIGLLTQQCVALSGAMGTYVSEINPTRRSVASALGASEVFDPAATDLVKEIVERTTIGVDLAFDCAGANLTLQTCLEATRMAGRAVVVALAWEPVRCLPVDWVGREVEMKATYGTLPSEWPLALWLLESKKVDVEPLITNIIPLEDIQEAFQELLKPDTSWIQTVVSFE